jgi:DNA-binding GntR family transcriptional regulator
MLKRGLLAAAMAVSALVAAAPASAGPVMDAIRARDADAAWRRMSRHVGAYVDRAHTVGAEPAG